MAYVCSIFPTDAIHTAHINVAVDKYGAHHLMARSKTRSSADNELEIVRYPTDLGVYRINVYPKMAKKP